MTESEESNNLFRDLEGFIIKWTKRSKIAFNRLIEYIFNLFVKTYYVELSFKMGLDRYYNFSKVITANLLYETEVKLDNIQFFKMLKVVDIQHRASFENGDEIKEIIENNLKENNYEKEHEEEIAENDIVKYIELIKSDKIPKKVITLLDFFPEYIKDYDEEKKTLYYLRRLIDSFFKEFSKMLNITPKSFIHKSLSLKFLKYFELEFFIRKVRKIIDDLFLETKKERVKEQVKEQKREQDQVENSLKTISLYQTIHKCFFHNGGIVGKFYLYCYRELLGNTNPNIYIGSKIKGQLKPTKGWRNSSSAIGIEKENFLVLPIWLEYLIYNRVFQNFIFLGNLFGKKELQDCFALISIANMNCRLGSFFNILLSYEIMKDLLDSLLKTNNYNKISDNDIISLLNYLAQNTYVFGDDPLTIDILKYNNAFVTKLINMKDFVNNSAYLNRSINKIYTNLSNNNFFNISGESKFIITIPTSNIALKNSFISPPTQKFNVTIGAYISPRLTNNMKIKQIKHIKEYKKLLGKSLDFFSVAILRNILLLKDEEPVNISYLLLPEYILMDPFYRNIRKYILENCQIIDIFSFNENVITAKLSPEIPFILLGVRKLNNKGINALQLQQSLNDCNVFIQNFSIPSNSGDRIHSQIFSKLKHFLSLLSQLPSDRTKFPNNAVIDADFKLTESPQSSIYKNKDQNLWQTPIFNHYKINQSDFLQNPNFEFDIFTNVDEKKWFQKLSAKVAILAKRTNKEENSKFMRLKDYLDINMGMNISKKGEIIQCYNCKLWLPIPKWTIDKYTGDKYAKCNICKCKIYLNKIKKRDKIILPSPKTANSYADKNKIKELFPDLDYFYAILEENVEKFYINRFSILKANYKGIAYNPSKVFDEKKIVLIIDPNSYEIIATIDYNKMHIIQPVFQLTIKKEFKQYPFLLEYILGFITSSTINLLYSKYYKLLMSSLSNLHTKSTQSKVKKTLYSKRLNTSNRISNLLNIVIPKIDFHNPNDYSYYIYVCIALYTMFIMLLTQLQNENYVDRSLLQNINKFLKKYRKYLESRDILQSLFDCLGADPLDAIRNPKILKNAIEKKDLLIDKVNNLIKKIFQ
ncbi:MAG: hypothetical protein ACTSRZ_17315 [Promethearchaeota archaeon]